MRRDKSPVGSTAAERAKSRADRSAAYREESQRLAPYDHVARVVIGRRAELGLTPQELASRMGTSLAAISRIERGGHGTSARMLRWLAAALEIDFVTGVANGPAEQLIHEIVAG